MRVDRGVMKHATDGAQNDGDSIGRFDHGLRRLLECLHKPRSPQKVLRRIPTQRELRKHSNRTSRASRAFDVLENLPEISGDVSYRWVGLGDPDLHARIIGSRATDHHWTYGLALPVASRASLNSSLSSSGPRR